jgi:glycopeptide antibiotics resistance protein
LKKFRFSLFYALLLMLTTPFHLQLERLFVRLSWFRLLNYALLGVLLAFFAVAFVRAFAGKKIHEIGGVLFAAAVIFYFMFQRRIFLSLTRFSLLLHIAEFFLLGWILFKENKRSFSPAAVLILFASAIGFEAVQLIMPDRIFELNDIWINCLSGLAGFLAGL